MIQARYDDHGVLDELVASSQYLHVQLERMSAKAWTLVIKHGKDLHYVDLFSTKEVSPTYELNR